MKRTAAIVVLTLIATGASGQTSRVGKKLTGPEMTGTRQLMVGPDSLPTLFGMKNIPTDDKDRDRDFGLQGGKGLHQQIFNKTLGWDARRDSTGLVSTHEYNRITLLLWHSTRGTQATPFQIAISVRCFFLGSSGAADTTFAFIASPFRAGDAIGPAEADSTGEGVATPALGDSSTAWPYEFTWMVRANDVYRVKTSDGGGAQMRGRALKLDWLPWSPYKVFTFRLLGPAKDRINSDVTIVAHLVGTPL